MSGTVYGIGVGPGDPDLLTLKALRLIRACPVLAYPALEQGDSLARAIVASHLADRAPIEFPIRLPMDPDPAPARRVYDAASETLRTHLDAGRDVAVLCQGDPFFYGSFMYLFARLAVSYAVTVVPGVSSLTACAAAAAWPLVARAAALLVLPAPLPNDELLQRMAAAETVAFIKVGRHFARLRALLESVGLASDARYVERASLASERVLPLEAVDPEAVPYFSMILLHRPAR